MQIFRNYCVFSESLHKSMTLIPFIIIVPLDDRSGKLIPFFTGSNTTANRTEDLEPDAKRQKTSFDSNVALTTALVQGLPVMLNDEGTMNALQTHYAELAAQQQLNDGSSVPGAIAIPIQVRLQRVAKIPLAFSGREVLLWSLSGPSLFEHRK